MTILSIDSGTTNTRVCLWRDGRVLAQSETPVGVRDCAASGSNGILKQAVRNTIFRVLSDADRSPDQVALLLASGMITSSLGLFELPHLPAPSGIADLASGMVMADLPDVFPKPIWFIPGVRNTVAAIDTRNPEAMDMMRGEEVEVIGLIERLGLTGPAMIVLPGSHTKFVGIDGARRITGCTTTLAGELLQAITQNTLLSKSLDGQFADTIDPAMLLAGASAVRKLGLTRASFCVRTLDLFGATDRNARANYLLGMVLACDLQALRHGTSLPMRADMPIVVAGKAILSQAFTLLLDADPWFTGHRTIVSERNQANLAGSGALALAALRGLTNPHRQ
jgi:2-dehydro-3-deoxygalactonokinase